MRPSAPSCSSTRPDAPCTLAEHWHLAAQLDRGRLAARRERSDRLGFDGRQPRRRVSGDVAVPDEADQPLALFGRDGIAGGGLHDRHEVERDDEHRPAHRQHPQHGALLVQRVLDVRRSDVGHAGPEREEDRRRVGGVEGDQIPRHLRDVRSSVGTGEPVTMGEAGAALRDADRPLHPGHDGASAT
jgi:hypothetical protein